MKIKNINKIYCLNHINFSDRRKKIEDKLKIQNIDYELVQKFHPSEIDYEKEIYGWDHSIPIKIVHPYGEYDNTPRKISIGSLSLVLKHLWCYNEQIKNNFKYVLILEDDTEIPENFRGYIENIMDEFIILEKEEGIGGAMIGTSHNFNVKNKKEGKILHYNQNQKTRCTHAYILNLKSTIQIFNTFKPINNPIDYKLNEIIELNKIKIAWVEPGLKQIR